MLDPLFLAGHWVLKWWNSRAAWMYLASLGRIPPRRAEGHRDGFARHRGPHAVRIDLNRTRKEARSATGARGGGPAAARTDRVWLVDGFELFQPAGRGRRRFGNPRHVVQPSLFPMRLARGRVPMGELNGEALHEDGDSGQTGLLRSKRVSKDDPRVEAMGAVDELNAALGLPCCTEGKANPRFPPEDSRRSLHRRCGTRDGQQSEGTKMPRVTEAYVARLEAGSTGSTSARSEFILPRGSEALVRLHWARTVARRAERRVVALSKGAQVSEDVMRYMNRLSSLLYQMRSGARSEREEGRAFRRTALSRHRSGTPIETQDAVPRLLRCGFSIRGRVRSLKKSCGSAG